MRGYYLTTAQHAISNVTKGRIKVALIGDLNDPFELSSYDESDPRLRERFTSARQQLQKEHGVICFSKKWSNPVLWAHYADKHRGIALGFDVDDTMLKSIEYVDARSPWAESRLDVEETERWLFRKYKDWAYEEELRAWTQLDHEDKEGDLYFLQFSEKIALKEVALGVRCDTPLAEVQSLVNGLYTDVRVVKASMASNQFAVIEQPAT
jgi:Protein of unknown function (DUF2971)